MSTASLTWRSWRSSFLSPFSDYQPLDWPPSSPSCFLLGRRMRWLEEEGVCRCLSTRLQETLLPPSPLLERAQGEAPMGSNRGGRCIWNAAAAATSYGEEATEKKKASEQIKTYTHPHPHKSINIHKQAASGEEERERERDSPRQRALKRNKQNTKRKKSEPQRKEAVP